MTAAGATATRERQLRLGMMSALVYRVASAIGPLVSIPIGFAYLGTGTFTVWMVSAGLTSFLAFADLGLGNHLMSRLSVLQAGSSAEGDTPTGAIRALLSESYSIVLAVAASLGLLLTLGWALVPLDRVIGLASLRGSDRYVVLICFWVFLANVPASLIVRVMFGLQLAATSYLVQSAGPILSVASMVVAVHAHAPGAVVVLGAVSGPLVVNLATTAWLFGQRLPALRPGLGLVRAAEAAGTLRSGGAFLAISVTIAVSESVDLALIPHFLDTRHVAAYVVGWRVWAQLGLVASLITLPFWPAAGDALARGDHAWVRARVRRLMVLNVGVLLAAAIFLVVAGPRLIDLWLGRDAGVGHLLLASMSLWWLTVAAAYPVFMVQNAVHVLKPQLVGWVVFLVLSTAVKYVALRAGAGGPALPLIAVVTWTLTVIPCAVVGYRTALRRTGAPAPV